jgi:hypothetical protein
VRMLEETDFHDDMLSFLSLSVSLGCQPGSEARVRCSEYVDLWAGSPGLAAGGRGGANTTEELTPRWRMWGRFLWEQKKYICVAFPFFRT